MILALVDDLMVGLRIEETAKAVGTRAETVSSDEEAWQRMKTEEVEGVVVDLAMTGRDVADIASRARRAGAWLIAFYPHVNIELRRSAQSAGIHAYPRSRFLRDLPKLLLERLEKKA